MVQDQKDTTSPLPRRCIKVVGGVARKQNLFLLSEASYEAARQYSLLPLRAPSSKVWWCAKCISHSRIEVAP